MMQGASSRPAEPTTPPPLLSSQLSLGTPRVDLIAGRPVSHPGRVIRPDIQRASDTIFTADRTSTEEAVKEQEEERGGEDQKENRHSYVRMSTVVTIAKVTIWPGSRLSPHSDSHTTDAAICCQNVPGHSEEPQSQCWSKNMILISG